MRFFLTTKGTSPYGNQKERFNFLLRVNPVVTLSQLPGKDNETHKSKK
ncbi:Hypothetical protein I595_3152 [Croceitalea dokdonensis DOKDO 023]|uniref:Uncharacterized protein n=1 Tax=Croceitalea dokdonensis DOKDO 023 TaxID=1300341 RepID=A0A0P7A2F6_9FLAO|nr:Hypothetical protein I595_3152 [Croceitalea dokdonensis DOKDO 023]